MKSLTTVIMYFICYYSPIVELHTLDVSTIIQSSCPVKQNRIIITVSPMLK